MQDYRAGSILSTAVDVPQSGRGTASPDSSAERDTAHRMDVAHCNPIAELTTNDGGHNITITLQSR